MKRLREYTEVELAEMGGKVGPSQPRERISAGRKPEVSRVPIKVTRTNHLPARRPLYAEQRQPEA